MTKFKILFIFILQYVKCSNFESCNTINCSIEQGICIKNICECFYEYTTLNGSNINSNDQKFCNYKKHCRITAFLLEFLFPIGVGHLYTRKINLALFKFTIFLIFFSFLCGEFCYLNYKLNAMNKCHIYLAFLIVLNIFLWICLHICDLVGYGFGFYKDGNGIELI